MKGHLYGSNIYFRVAHNLHVRMGYQRLDNLETKNDICYESFDISKPHCPISLIFFGYPITVRYKAEPLNN